MMLVRVRVRSREVEGQIRRVWMEEAVSFCIVVVMQRLGHRALNFPSEKVTVVHLR